jgi:hypothetical protein
LLPKTSPTRTVVVGTVTQGTILRLN